MPRLEQRIGLRRHVPVLLSLALLALASGSDWRQFRGSDSSGVAPDGRGPAAATADNLAWKVELPGRTASGPIVVGNRVFVTADSGYRNDRLHVFAFDAETGRQLWERQFWATGRTQCHPTSAVAAPTPASDGKFVYAFFSSNDLICLDLDGNLQWFRGLAHDFPAAGNDVGMASSPVVADGTVVVQVENQGDSFAAGIDAATGETRWRIERPRQANWASPSVLHGDRPGQELVVLQCGANVSAHRPRTGEAVWSYEMPCKNIASTAVVGDTVLAVGDNLVALNHSTGSASPVLWQEVKLAASPASPVADKEKVFALKRTVLVCGGMSDGEVLWQLRLKGGNFWGTPVVAGNRLYAASDDGIVQVVDISGAKGEIVSEYALEDPVLGSPALADGALYIRGRSGLYKFVDRP